MLDELREVCAREARRSDSEAQSLYQDRLREQLERKMMQPYCIPYVEGGRKHLRKWVNSSQIYVDSNFAPYHHSFEEIVERAVEKRADIESLYREMNQLYLDEYPFPGGRKVYFVSQNGHHRRLEFACIGLPKLEAYVQEAQGDVWRYFFKPPRPDVIKVLRWFLDVGLLDNVEIDYRSQSILIEDGGSLGAWLLPDSQRCIGLGSLLSEIRLRADFISSHVEIDDKILNILNSKVRRYLAVQVVDLKYRFRRFLKSLVASLHSV